HDERDEYGQEDAADPATAFFGGLLREPDGANVLLAHRGQRVAGGEAGCSGLRLDRDALPDRAIATEGAAFLFGHAAPHAGVLAGRERPFEAGTLDRAGGAERPGGFDLGARRG